jgi:prephenate dehydrogenase
MDKPAVRRVAVIGVGLIGGSLALALKRAGTVLEVTGCSRTRATLDKALKLGVIDRGEPEAAKAVAGADLVVLATPVGTMAGTFAAIAPALGAQAIVTDAGSVKLPVIAAARKSLGRHYKRFVPGHPVAGKESSGVEAARADLFDGQQVILTPEPETDPACVETVRRCWEAAGARVAEMSAARHDELLAKVSHLPHALAFALVNAVAAGADRDTLFDLAAGGFYDTTRIASSDAEMWRDIFLANREPLLAALAAFDGELGRLRALISAGDAEGLHDFCARARGARNQGLRRKNHG